MCVCNRNAHKRALKVCVCMCGFVCERKERGGAFYILFAGYRVEWIFSKFVLNFASESYAQMRDAYRGGASQRD